MHVSSHPTTFHFTPLLGPSRVFCLFSFIPLNPKRFCVYIFPSNSRVFPGFYHSFKEKNYIFSLSVLGLTSFLLDLSINFNQSWILSLVSLDLNRVICGHGVSANSGSELGVEFEFWLPIHEFPFWRYHIHQGLCWGTRLGNSKRNHAPLFRAVW